MASVVTGMVCASVVSLGALALVMAAGKVGCASQQEQAAGAEPQARPAVFPGSALQAESPWAVGHLTHREKKEHHNEDIGK